MILKAIFQPHEQQAPFLIAGLGNPGRQYQHTRHNIGFMILDRLAERLGCAFSRLESKALVTKGDYQSHRLVLAKPQTFMNLSGQAIGALVKFYKVPLDRILVVYDDADLPLGTLRMRPSGGSAGQKGMGSILERLGTQDLPRLRFGIGRPPGRMPASAYVLQDFGKDDLEFLPELLDRSVDAILAFVTDGLETAMNQYNGQNISNGA